MTSIMASAVIAPTLDSRLDPHLAVAAQPQQHRCQRQRPRLPATGTTVATVVPGHHQAQPNTERAEPIGIVLGEHNSTGFGEWLPPNSFGLRPTTSARPVA
jgi:hypothetical protein